MFRPFVYSLVLALSAMSGVHAHSISGQDTGLMDRDSCAAAHPAAVWITVSGMKSQEGNLRVQLYGNGEAEWLEKGKKLIRLQRPVDGDPMTFCLPIPEPGDYGIVAMHDLNSNGKANVFSDGFGFSNNPKLGLSKPSYKKARISLETGLSDLPIEIKYYFSGKSKKRARRR